MIIVFNIPWIETGTKEYKDSLLSCNQYHKDADYVVDATSSLFSKMSSQYPRDRRVLVTGEPSPIMQYTNEKTTRINDYYGVILSWHEQLKQFPQTRPWRFGTTWVTWQAKPNKKFGLSAVFSPKYRENMYGYSIRKKLIEASDRLYIPNHISYPGGKNPYPVPQKNLDYMYHWAVENCSEPGYFSEKIVDCFMAYVVPVYYGDPLIGDIFDLNGIIRLDEADPIGQANSLTERFYEDNISAILENHKRAIPYTNILHNIHNTLAAI